MHAQHKNSDIFFHFCFIIPEKHTTLRKSTECKMDVSFFTANVSSYTFHTNKYLVIYRVTIIILCYISERLTCPVSMQTVPYSWSHCTVSLKLLWNQSPNKSLRYQADLLACTF